MAEININAKKNSQNPVSIIPFSDSDKNVARFIEKILNREMRYENEIEDRYNDFNFRLMNEII
jgi:hypothetical protein